MTRGKVWVTVCVATELEVHSGWLPDCSTGRPWRAASTATTSWCGVPCSGRWNDCAWTVTARVQHMQHVHFRHNTYSGVLTIDIVGDRWKIAGIELTSEVRRSVSRSLG